MDISPVILIWSPPITLLPASETLSDVGLMTNLQPSAHSCSSSINWKSIVGQLADRPVCMDGVAGVILRNSTLMNWFQIKWLLHRFKNLQKFASCVVWQAIYWAGLEQSGFVWQCNIKPDLHASQYSVEMCKCSTIEIHFYACMLYRFQ